MGETATATETAARRHRRVLKPLLLPSPSLALHSIIFIRILLEAAVQLSISLITFYLLTGTCTHTGHAPSVDTSHVLLATRPQHVAKADIGAPAADGAHECRGDVLEDYGGRYEVGR